MLKQHVLFVAAICLLCHSVGGDTKPSQLTQFRPISQSEYEAILSLTDGKQVVSEGRLISGGLATLAGLTNGWATSLRFPNIFGALGLSGKSSSNSYPLCVIKTDDEKQHHNEDHEHHEHHEDYEHNGHHGHHVHHDHHHRTDDSYESSEGDYNHYSHEHHTPDHSYEIQSHEHYDNVEMTWNKNKLSPVVNCIVVLKEDNHHTTTTKRPKRPRKKHRIYAPPPPLLPPPAAPPSAPTAAYPHSAPPSTYAVQPPPAGSYNNLWYWQSLYYNPYYSDPRAHTGIYPGAYPDIYAAIYPGAYPGNYPGSYPDAFATAPAGVNPNAYYDPSANTFSDTPTSAGPSDSYNTQPSSYTSTYPRMEISVVEQIPTANLDANYYNNFENSFEETQPTPSEPSTQAGYTAQFDAYRSGGRIASAKSKDIASKNLAATKVPVSSLKIKSKHSIKSRPKKEMSVAQTASTKVTPTSTATRRHTKAKRDEAGAQTQTQTHSYAKIASYTEGGYQPTLYPQNSYQSDYPKVSYTHALPYPAPVYVRNNIEQQSAATAHLKRQQAHEADSEEDDDSGEFIQVRRNH